jgi:hypothetical protein
VLHDGGQVLRLRVVVRGRKCGRGRHWRLTQSVAPLARRVRHVIVQVLKKMGSQLRLVLSMLLMEGLLMQLMLRC